MNRFKCGLCSVSFRDRSPEEILRAMSSAGLGYVEWGSDVHAPHNDTDKLNAIARLQKEYGIRCASYGTYFRLGAGSDEELRSHIRAAEILGTDLLRLWCGVKGSADLDPQERRELFDACRRAAEIARECDVTLAMECHAGTYTDTADSIAELMAETADQHFRMYWQPNQYRSTEENVAHLKKTREFVTSVHAFNWIGNEKYPLADAVAQWREYLSCLEGEHTVLLEFMPDGQLHSLAAEAEALFAIVDKV